MHDTACKASQRVMASIALLPALYALTLMWWIPEGDKYIPGMIVVLAIIYLLQRNLKGGSLKRSPPSRSAWVLALIWLYVCYGILIYFWKGDSWTELRAMFAMAIYL